MLFQQFQDVISGNNQALDITILQIHLFKAFQIIIDQFFHHFLGMKRFSGKICYFLTNTQISDADILRGHQLVIIK